MKLIYTTTDTLLLNEPEDCTNSGPCCFSCPMFNQCDHHYDPEPVE